MKKLQALNKRTAPKSVMPEKIIQFGEGTSCVLSLTGLFTI